jgi:hypothetical protein
MATVAVHYRDFFTGKWLNPMQEAEIEKVSYITGGVDIG